MNRMSRKEFLKRREMERTTGYEFELPDASRASEEPFVVRLRRLSVQEKAAVNGISQDVQDEVYRRTRKLAEWSALQARRKTSVKNQMDELRQNNELQSAVNAVVWAALIEPKVVETLEELETNPDAWLVDDFSIDDRWAIFNASTSANSEEAKSLTLFRPESVSNVRSARAGEVAESSESAPVLSGFESQP